MDRVYESPYRAANGIAPRVILITVDTLRADALGFSSEAKNGVRAETPNLDRLASDSFVFSNAFSSSPWTKPSMATIMSGLSPYAHHIVWAAARVPDRVETLAEILATDGYYTGAVGDSPFLGRFMNVDQGFRDYEFYPRPIPGRSLGTRLVRRVFPALYSKLKVTTQELGEKSIEWINRNEQKDFFFWLHIFDPHDPYTPPAEFVETPYRLEGKSFGDGVLSDEGVILGPADLSEPERRDWIRDLYLAEVGYVDATIGRVLDHLREKNLYDDSLIIVTSDHGDEFWEHDRWGHGHALYNEVVHVPLIIKMPGRPPANTAGDSASETLGNSFTIDFRVANGSLLPTLIDILNLETTTPEFSYPSFASFLLAEPHAAASEPIITSAVNTEGRDDRKAQESIIVQGRKLIRYLESGDTEVYDLENDPGELSPLRGEDDAFIPKAMELIDSHRKKSNRLRDRLELEDEKNELGDEAIAHLKKIGYL